jgi:hypothetical protein
MNIFLWIVQGIAALLYVPGGAFKIFKTDAMPGFTRRIPSGAWKVIGLVELLGGIALVVPGSMVGIPTLNGVAAAVLGLETLAIAAFYGRQSTKMMAANPFFWSVIQLVLVAIIAFGRMYR